MLLMLDSVSGPKPVCLQQVTVHLDLESLKLGRCWRCLQDVKRKGVPGGDSSVGECGGLSHWSAQARGERAGTDGPLPVVASSWGFRCGPIVGEAEHGVWAGGGRSAACIRSTSHWQCGGAQGCRQWSPVRATKGRVFGLCPGVGGGRLRLLTLIYYQLHVADEPKPSMIAHRTWAMHSNGQYLWVLWFMSMLQRVFQARLPCRLAARSVFVSWVMRNRHQLQVADSETTAVAHCGPVVFRRRAHIC